jgi:hypothetical protein
MYLQVLCDEYSVCYNNKYGDAKKIRIQKAYKWKLCTNRRLILTNSQNQNPAIETNSPWASKEISKLLRKSKVYCRVCKSSVRVSDLSQVIPVLVLMYVCCFPAIHPAWLYVPICSFTHEASWLERWRFRLIQTAAMTLHSRDWDILLFSPVLKAHARIVTSIREWSFPSTFF